MTARTEFKIGDKIGECFYIKDVKPVGRGKNMQRKALFMCICEKLFACRIQDVRIGKTTSCGCGITQRERQKAIFDARPSKLSKLGEYRIWAGMKMRCYNKNEKAYKNYGAKGIIICDRWLNSFANFYADMGPRPSKDHSIDRFPNKTGNYEPGNCRWATRLQQARNKTTSLIVEYKGYKLSPPEYEELVGLKARIIRERLSYGWPVSKIFQDVPFPAKALTASFGAPH